MLDEQGFVVGKREQRRALLVRGDVLEHGLDHVGPDRRQFAERRETALASASQRLAEAEASRQRAAAQLEKLKADYAAALAAAAAGTRLRRQRARALAEIRVEELRAEIERTRRSLVEALERLVEAAGGAEGLPSPA